MLKQLNRYRDIYNIYNVLCFIYVCIILFVDVAVAGAGGVVVAVVGTAAAALSDLPEFTY